MVCFAKGREHQSACVDLQDEVRALGRLPQLSVPEAFISRHPFPGQEQQQN